MLIGIDASRAISNAPTGTETYSRELIRALLALEQANLYRLYTRENVAREFFAPPVISSAARNLFARSKDFSVASLPRNDKQWLVTQDDIAGDPDAVRISALKGQGLDALLVRVEQVLGENMVALRVRIPYSASELAALFHQRGIVDHEEFVEKGTLIEGKIAARLVERFEQYEI